jgi:hypothetical protein
LREDEIVHLEQFFQINRSTREDAVYTAPAVQLLDQRKMDEFVETFGILMKALDPAAAAAAIAAQFSYVGLALQVAASAFGHAPHLSLNNLTFEMIPQAARPLISFRIHEWSTDPVSTAGDDCARTKEFVQKLTDFYGNTVRPLFEALSRSASIDIGQLWGQLPTRFNYYLGLITEDPRFAFVRARIESDYALLKYAVDPDVFGRTRNPFDVKVTMIESLYDPDKQTRIKNVCCLYYRTEGGQYCYTCPRMKENDRAERRAEARAEHLTAAVK